MSDLTRQPAVPPLRRLSGHDEDGIALVMVTILVVVLMLLALIAFGAAGFNLTNAAETGANAQTDGSANAGLSAAIYDIENGNFVCTVGTPAYPVALQSAPHGGNASYSVSVTYYNAYVDPEVTTNQISCPLNGYSPSAAVVTSTGYASFGRSATTETITELVDITAVPVNYALFSGSSSALDLTGVQLLQPTNSPVGYYGQVYADGNITGPSSGGCNLYGSFMAVGSETFSGGSCTIAGSLYAGNNVTLSQTTVGGSVEVNNGSLTMSQSTVTGNAVVAGSSPAGSILMCPTGNTLPAACSGLSSGQSYIGESGAAATATATGSVTVGAMSPITSTQCPSVTDSTSHDEVYGCVYGGNATATVNAPPSIALPTISAPVSAGNGGTSAQQGAYNAWTTPGAFGTGTATVVNVSSCTGTGAGSLYGAMTAATTPTVIVANCAANFTNGNPYKMQPFIPQANIAVFAPGFTFGNGFQFKDPGNKNPAVSLAFIVPTPTNGLCTASNDITFGSGSGNDISASDTAFLFTPCTLSSADNLSITGEAYFGSLSVTKQLNLTYSPFTPPGLSFGYEVFPEERIITQGG